MLDPQYQSKIGQATPDGNSAGPRSTKWREFVVTEGGADYETVAASQTDQFLGATGAIGDYLKRLIITVGTAATAATSIKDGAGSSIPILPNSPGGGVGVYVVDIGASATGAGWSVTTGAGATVVAVGRFT